MKRALRNIRSGRLQRSLALTAGLSTVPLAFEIYLEHYKASFGDRWEWTPIALTPPLLIAGIGGALPGGERVARRALPVTGALYALNGAIGTVLHARQYRRAGRLIPVGRVLEHVEVRVAADALRRRAATLARQPLGVRRPAALAALGQVAGLPVVGHQRSRRISAAIIAMPPTRTSEPGASSGGPMIRLYQGSWRRPPGLRATPRRCRNTPRPPSAM